MAPTPRKIILSFSDSQIEQMLTLLKSSALPPKPPIPTENPWELGIDHTYLTALKYMFETEWTWKQLSDRINAYDNFIVQLEDGGELLDVHYIHAKSARSNAVPLLLLHGWPGTVYDFHKVIGKLIDPPDGQPAFHVVVPSIPGFFLSSHPQREGWQLSDTARLVHRLMVEALGYPKYAAQGGDWGSYILRITGCLYSDAVPLILFNMFRCPAITDHKSAALSPVVKKNLERRELFAANGRGYVEIQGTKPFTIGFAAGSSPLGVLSWIGEKIYVWSDPQLVDTWDIINTVALYWLSGSFATSVLVYHQSRIQRVELTEVPGKWRMKSKIGYHVFPYEIGGSPPDDVRAVGELKFYVEHDKGGHFPALDDPDTFVSDVRECFRDF